MADTVTGPTILQQNDNRVVIKIVQQSDGTGKTTVFGDVSAMTARQDGTSVAHLALMRIWFSCVAGDGNDAYGRLDEEDSDGDKSSNSNESDVNFVVPGAADSGNMYTVVAEFQKIY